MRGFYMFFMAAIIGGLPLFFELNPPSREKPQNTRPPIGATDTMSIPGG